MRSNRADGCSGNVSVNPSAVLFNGNTITGPEVLSSAQLAEHLSQLGYVDAGTDQAARFIETVGYQHLKLYLPKTGVKSLCAAHDALLTDMEFQRILLEYIGLFEIAFRARYSRNMAELRGPLSHTLSSNFLDGRRYERSYSSYRSELSRRAEHDKSYREDIATWGDVPIWKACEAMSLGTLSKLYRNTKSKAVKRNVAVAFGTDYTTLASWLHAIASVRNRCAHFGKVLGSQLTSRPKKLPDNPRLGTGHPFYIILLLVFLLSEGSRFVDGEDLSHDLLLIQDVSALVNRRSASAIKSGIPFNWDSLIAHVEKSCGVEVEFRQRSSYADRATQ